ncbi:MAG: hypothetical protein IJV05_06775 [Muribaculaceae bacterium]|nr:hypothetical protein [Muribaculaceae bacterium]
MKKSFIYLFALLAVVMFTSCGNDDEPVNKQTFTSTINTRAIEDDAVVFSQGSASVEANFTNMTIQFTSDFKDANGRSHSITTPEMPMTSTVGTIYSFGSAASTIGSGADNLRGNIDLATGMMWYTFTLDGSTTVVSTTHLLYAYTTTTLTNPSNGNTGENNSSAYLFALSATGESCIMQISNFMSSLGSGVIDAAELQYNGLNVLHTPTGYVITADEVESSYKGFYTLTDVHFELDDQCRVIEGAYKCNGLDFKVNGDLFPKAN